MASYMTRHAQAIADKLNGMNEEELRSWLQENDLGPEYKVELRGSGPVILGVEIWITVGGPTVWIDTRSGLLHAWHGDDKGWTHIDPDTNDTIHRIYEEIFFSCI